MATNIDDLPEGDIQRYVELRMKRKNRVPLKKLAQVASIATGVQFGWALQLSLLTPSIQALGIPHAWASFIWLCGPITGMIVQPLVGHYSDNCPSKWGRRRPFIAAGALLVAVGVMIIGFAPDIGYVLGDRPTFKIRAIIAFIFGFWILDLANNTLQGPCRALLADFTGRDSKRTRKANAYFSGFMAIGNILGFATGSYDGWHKLLPFTVTTSCNYACANLKSAFFIDIILLFFCTFLSVTAAPEKPWTPEGQLPTSSTPLLKEEEKRSIEEEKKSVEEEAAQAVASVDRNGATQHQKDTAVALNSQDEEEEEEDDMEEEEETKFVMWELLAALKSLPLPMWFVLLVTALTWLSWFPFLLFDTDWMGREVYRGSSDGSSTEVAGYNSGVHAGALGLMFNSVVLGLSSLAIDPLCRKMGSRLTWAVSNAVLALCLAGTFFVGRWKGPLVSGAPPTAIYWSALGIFTVLGFPLAVTYSVPYSLMSTYTSQLGGGQGLNMGVLNLAVVVPQVIVSVGSGPWDALFGGGNEPAFVLGAVFAAVGSIAAILLLPKPPPPAPEPTPKLRRSRTWGPGGHL